MTALAIAALVLGLLCAGAFVGMLIASLMASGAREDACRECPDRRFSDAVMDWKDGTE